MRILTTIILVLPLLACSLLSPHVPAVSPASPTAAAPAPSSSPVDQGESLGTLFGSGTTALDLIGSFYNQPNLCTNLFLELQTGSGSPSNAATTEAFSITTSSSTGTFFSDPNCTQPLNADNLALPLSTLENAGFSFNYADPTPGSSTLTAMDKGTLNLPPAKSQMHIEDPTHLQLAEVNASGTSTPNSWSVSVGACTWVAVYPDDASGNGVETLNDIDVTLSVNAPGSYLYSDVSCTQEIGIVTIDTQSLQGGNSDNTFYFKSKTPGSFEVTGSAPASAKMAAAKAFITVGS